MSVSTARRGTASYLVNRMVSARKLEQGVRRILEPYELSLTQLSIMVRLADTGTQRPMDLARYLHVEAPLISALTPSLLQRCLIKFAPQSPDGRERKMELTLAGLELLGQIEAELAAREVQA